MDATKRTGLSWTTVNKARWELVSRDVARRLSRYSRGEVSAESITKPNTTYRLRTREVA